MLTSSSYDAITYTTTVIKSAISTVTLYSTTTIELALGIPRQETVNNAPLLPSNNFAPNASDKKIGYIVGGVGGAVVIGGFAALFFFTRRKKVQPVRGAEVAAIGTNPLYEDVDIRRTWV